MESNNFQIIKEVLDDRIKVKHEPETDNESTQKTANKFHKPNQIDWDKIEKVQVRYEDVNELNVCTICQRNFHSRNELENHLSPPIFTKSYSCCACEKTFKASSRLVEHRRKHTGDKPYVCGFCSKRFTTKGNLTTHLKIHAGERGYECFDCGKKFVLPQHLARHSKVHIITYTCPVCYDQFESKDSLDQHSKAHTDQENNRNKCDICSEVFLTSGKLQRHFQIVHEGIKAFVCEICGNRFSRARNRDGHMKIHNGGKPFSCDICKIGFLRKGYLKAHMLIHGPQNLYECQICGVGFPAKKRLSEHIKKKHEIGKNVVETLGVKMEQVQNGKTISDSKENAVFIKEEPEESQVKDKMEQEEILEQYEQTLTHHKENTVFIKVEPEDPQIVEVKIE